MNKTIAKIQTWTAVAVALLAAHSAPAQSLWNNSSGNWSVPANWLPSGAPTVASNVLFTNNTGAAAAAGVVDNTVDTAFAGLIGSLQYVNTNASGGAGYYHTTQIALGQTLTNAGSLTVGTLKDSGSVCQVNATITGAGATLLMTNTAASLVVNQASASSGAHVAVLNMAGLDTFVANIGRIQVGVANGVNRAEGILYLAKTNTITLSGAAPQLYMGFNNGNNDGNAEFPILYLGQTNSFYVNSIGFSADKQGNPASRVLFNSAFTNNNPIAYFRGAAGGSSRVSTWVLGNNSGQTTTASTSDSTNDFSNGTLDAMVDTMTLGISEKAGASGSGSGFGTLIFSAGTNNVNNLNLGQSLGNTGSSVGNGTMNVNGTATLVVNNSICLCSWIAPASISGAGNLNINGGTVLTATITNGVTSPGSAGAVQANVTMNSGTLTITSPLGSVGSTAWPLGIVTFNDSTINLPVSGVQTNVVAAIVNLGGTTNVINITSLGGITNYPTQIPLIACGSLSGFNIGVSNLPGTYQGYISNNTANTGTIDLVLTSGPTSITTLEWTGAAGATWDTASLDWLNGATPAAYFEGVNVQFDDTATGSTAITLTAGRTPGNVMVTNNALNYSFAGNGIGCVGTLTKSGTGTLLFTNPGNFFIGGMTINAGTVQFGVGGSSGGFPGTGSVIDNGTLIINHSINDSIANLISGTGALTKQGTGILTLTAPNSFSGTTEIDGGTLVLANNLSGLLTNAPGSTIGGPGTNVGPVNVSGTIEPGAASAVASTFTVGNLALSAGAVPAFNVNNGSNDLLQVNGNLGVNNNSIVLNFLTQPQTATPYTLIDFTGSQSGTFSSAVIGTHYTATVNQGASPITVSLSGSGANLEWTGTTNANWNVGVTSNWLNQGTSASDVFWSGDNVLFDENVAGVATNVTIAGPIAVPGLVTVNVTNKIFNLGGSGHITGGTFLHKNGPGLLVLNTPNDYTGDTIVAGGTLQLGVNNAAGNGVTYIANGATLDLANHASGSVGISGAGVNGLGAIINSVASVTGDQQAFGAGVYVYLEADATVGCPNRWDIRNGNLASGNGSPFNLTVVGTNLFALVNCTIDPALGNVDIKSGTLGLQTTTLSDSGGWASDTTHSITVETNGSLELDSSAVAGLGRNLIFNGGSTLISDGTFGLINGPMTLNGNVTNNEATALEIDSAIAGAGGMTKVGTAALTLTGASTYVGSTFISAGTVALREPGTIAGTTNIVIAAGAVMDASQRADQTLTLAIGQTLKGNGTINGNLVVGAGATVTAGTNTAAVGVLTVTNSVTLGGNTLMKINLAAGTNDVIGVIDGTNVTYGGTLTLTNISATPYAAGNNLKLFNAAGYVGSFASIVPATPGAGLAWSTNNLGTGVLSVVSTVVPQPHLTGIQLIGTSLVISGTNGLAGEQYNVLTTTNLATPLTNWTVLPTNSFVSGNFSITNTVNPAAPQSYYILRVP